MGRRDRRLRRHRQRVTRALSGPPVRQAKAQAQLDSDADGPLSRFSLQLARAGFNLVLVSRTATKLSALASSLETTHGVQTKTHAMDFAQGLDADFSALSSLLAPLDVSVLINNVGLSHAIPVPFTQTADAEMRDIVTVNCLGTLRVTRLVAPGMAQRRRGLVLTMASFGGVLPTPLLATYSGSKAFLQHWSSALASELEPSGVTVHLVQSYLVTSAMSKIRRASATVPTPRAFVKAALRSVGRSGGAQGVAYTGTPYWAHALMHWALLTFTGTMGKMVVRRNKVMHEGIRRRALRKMEREGKKAA